MKIEQFRELLTFKEKNYKGAKISAKQLTFLRELNIFSILAIDKLPNDDDYLVWVAEGFLQEAIKSGTISLEQMIDDIAFIGILCTSKTNHKKVTKAVGEICSNVYDIFLAEGDEYLANFIEEVCKNIQLFTASQINIK